MDSTKGIEPFPGRLLKLSVLLLLAGLTACSNSARHSSELSPLPEQSAVFGQQHYPQTIVGRDQASSFNQRPLPRIVSARAPLQCVPYARELTGAPIRGDAWTWWSSAVELYSRGERPRVGSVMVLKKTSRLTRGHLAVVTQILNEQEIVVRHANWLNRGRIHLDTPVKDVSEANDWSAVKVWYTPGETYGRRRYPVQGFINTELQQALN